MSGTREVQQETGLGAIRWNALFAVLFVVCPHAYHFHGLNVIEHLIDKTMLNIYSSRESPGKVTDQLLVGRRVLERIVV